MEKINQGELVAPYVPPTSFTSIGISHHPSPANSIVALAQSRTPTTGRSHISGLGPTDPKRLCLDQCEFQGKWDGLCCVPISVRKEGDKETDL